MERILEHITERVNATRAEVDKRFNDLITELTAFVRTAVADYVRGQVRHAQKSTLQRSSSSPAAVPIRIQQQSQSSSLTSKSSNNNKNHKQVKSKSQPFVINPNCPIHSVKLRSGQSQRTVAQLTDQAHFGSIINLDDEDEEEDEEEDGFGGQRRAQNYMLISGLKKFQCAYRGCGKRYLCRRDVERHFRIHTGEKPFKCRVKGCGMRFSDKSHFERHHKVHYG